MAFPYFPQAQADGMSKAFDTLLHLKGMLAGLFCVSLSLSLRQYCLPNYCLLVHLLVLLLMQFHLNL